MLALINTDTQNAEPHADTAPAMGAETDRIEAPKAYDWSNIVFSGAYCKEAERRLAG